MEHNDGLFELKGALQHYEWGGYDFIPNLLGLPPKTGEPVAELWMGTHHRGRAMVVTPTGEEPLDEWLAAHPEALGKTARLQFGDTLPFLFKVLDVREMLSIQTHPTKAQAEEGYARENAAGIPLDAPQRNFKDDNHKPEVMVALSPFWLLHGFRPVEEWAKLLEGVPSFKALEPLFSKRDIPKLYERLMYLPQPEVEGILAELHHDLKASPRTDKMDPGYWALQALESKGYDRGIFSIYLFNLVRLDPGQGIYQAAGIPHAYLEGVNVELMANSDNVFRGGLTPKHVDVPQLLDHIVMDAVHPEPLLPKELSAYEQAYPTPARDFQLNSLNLPKSKTYACTPMSVEILLVLEGKVRTSNRSYSRGQVLLATSGQPYRLLAEQRSVVFKATVPVYNS